MADQIEHHRPSPEALLEAAKGELRGRLKIFLGAAPGVGKTYAMLQAAQRARAEGIAVLVGIVETHGRAETDALLHGLEVLPRKDIPYRGRAMAEFDIDAALARKPRLLLLDELAHTNVPGSRHPKRFQDVEELLGAGIDVWTTLNVQHLESFNDIVFQITKVRVRETLPDSVLERADEIVLTDVTPEELLKRLKEGKVYIPEQAEQAMKGFFQPGNLTALRELALRRTAERVDSQMLNYMRQHAIAGPWPAGERIAVCISAHPDPMRLVRAGRRLADQLDAKWTALYIETPSHLRLSDEERDRVAAALRLAEYLGGEARTIPGADLIQELRRYARNNNVTQLVLGKSRRTRWRELFSRSLVHELLRQDDGLNIHVVSAAESEDEAKAARFASLGRRSAPWWAYAAATVSVALAGFVAKALEVWAALEPSTLSIVFLTSVLYSALTFGLLPSIFASLLAVLVYNFFFLPPLYTFTVQDPQNFLALVAFLIVAIFTSNLAGRTREQARATRRRFKTAAALYDFSRKLAATHELDDLLWVISHQVAAALGGKIVVLLPADGRIAIRAGYPPDDRLDGGDWAAANWAWEKGEVAGHGSSTMPNAERVYFPMRTGRGTVGVLGAQFDGTGLLTPEQRRMLEALLDQAAVAIERARLDREMQESRVLAETDKLRTALLSSISHDLRTPLTSILGSLATLRTKGDSLPASERGGLLQEVEGEAERLNQFVGNLLDMTRLEAGALTVKRDWLDLRELAGSAIGRARPRMGGRHVVLEVGPEVPLVRADFTLMQQVLFNLLDNAAKYSAEDARIRVEVHMENNEAVIAVTDDGIGIAPGDLEKVFDKFYRVTGGDRQVAGTGLGLAICRGIVEAHGGTIRAYSPVAGGRGTRIAVRLPLDARSPMMINR